MVRLGGGDMQRFLILVTVTVLLTTLWFVTALMLPVIPQMYFTLTAPWWHVVLHIAWLLIGAAASMQGVLLIYDWRSRRKEFAHQPPKQTR
jgi:hypothetical protein